MTIDGRKRSCCKEKRLSAFFQRGICCSLNFSIANASYLRIWAGTNEPDNVWVVAVSNCVGFAAVAHAPNNRIRRSEIAFYYILALVGPERDESVASS